MANDINHGRRALLGTAVMTIAAAHVGLFGGRARAQAKGASRELAALGRASEWLNSPRLTADSLNGKVVLVDFGTYTCINWLRTLPYVRAWAHKYREALTVIGVHTPEFPFEHNVNSVRRAVQQLRLEFPIVIDNNYSIWRAFDNQYWPALYLLDNAGARSPPPVRRGRVPQFGTSHSAAAERRRGVSCQRRRRVGRWQRLRSSR